MQVQAFVEVPAGAATRVRLTLSGATSETLLGTDEMLTVSFVYVAEGDGTAADVTVQGSVNFTATSGSLITLTLNAPRAAQPGTGTLTARIEDAMNATITPASLSVRNRAGRSRQATGSGSARRSSPIII